MPKIFIKILTMKKVYLLLSITIFSLVLVNLAQAQTATPSAGILPDSPFYFLKSWGEKIREAFIFSERAKLEYGLFLAERRMGESQALAEKGKSELAAKIAERSQALLDSVGQGVDRAIGQGRDLLDVKQKVFEARSKHIEVLQRVLNQVPAAAKDTILRVINQERAKLSATPLPTPAPGGAKGPTATPPGLQRSPAVTPSPSPSAPPSSVVIRILATGFSPASVTISRGTTVIFRNDDSVSHWPASGPHPTHTFCPGFDALRPLATGETYSPTFSEAKTCPYHDHLNPGVRGTIKVE